MANDAPASTTTTSPQANGQPPAAQQTAIVKAPPPPPDQGGAIDVFASNANFESAQRMAKALASSSLVPEAYRNNLPNVLIAMELSSRVGASVFAVMQNIDIIHGRPSWRATFLIATVNACGRFTPLRFRWEGKQGTDDWGCRAVARDKVDGEECIGALITVDLAKTEGWYGKNGSKWKTMPEQMLMYRAAAFWARAYAPELALGMQTTDEVQDIQGPSVIDARPLPAQLVPGNAQTLEAELLGKPPEAPKSEPKTSTVVDVGAAMAQAKAEEKPRAKAASKKAAPQVEIDPMTGEVVPPQGEADRGDDPNQY